MQNVTGSVALSEQAGVLLNSGSVTGLLVGGQPVAGTNPLPVLLSGSINASSIGPEVGATGSVAPVSGALAGFVDPNGNLQPGHVDATGAQIVTGSMFVTNFPFSQFVKQDSTPWIVSASSWVPTITGSVVVANTVNTAVTNFPAVQVVSASNWIPTITGSVRVENLVNVIGQVLATQGTSPWIVSGSNWIPQVTGSVRVENTVNVKQVAVSASVVFVSASSNTNTTVAAANPNRLGIILYNDTNKLLYVKLGVSASLNDYTTQMAKDDNYEIPFGYQGRIDAFSPAATTGVVRITEIV